MVILDEYRKNLMTKEYVSRKVVEILDRELDNPKIFEY